MSRADRIVALVEGSVCPHLRETANQANQAHQADALLYGLRHMASLQVSEMPQEARAMAARRVISSGRRSGKTLELERAIREHLGEGRTVAVATLDGTVDGEEYLQRRERTDP